MKRKKQKAKSIFLYYRYTHLTSWITSRGWGFFILIESARAQKQIRIRRSHTHRDHHPQFLCTIPGNFGRLSRYLVSSLPPEKSFVIKPCKLSSFKSLNDDYLPLSFHFELIYDTIRYTLRTHSDWKRSIQVTILLQFSGYTHLI